MRNFQFRILTILLSAIFSNYPHNTHNGKYSLLNPSSIHAVRNFQFRTIIILLSAISSIYPHNTHNGKYPLLNPSSTQINIFE